MPKNNFTIEANHQGYGTILFIIPANDAKDAFKTWKQILGNPRQWIVKRNETGAASPVPVSQEGMLDAVDPEFS
jgi:hypothetical protein